MAILCSECKRSKLVLLGHKVRGGGEFVWSSSKEETVEYWCEKCGKVHTYGVVGVVRHEDKA